MVIEPVSVHQIDGLRLTAKSKEYEIHVERCVRCLNDADCSDEKRLAYQHEALAVQFAEGR